MFAIVGIPGSSRHIFAYFPATRHDTAAVRARAEAWAAATARRTNAEHPSGVVSWRVLSDRAALAIRYRDGRRVYRTSELYPDQRNPDPPATDDRTLRTLAARLP